MKLSYFVSKLIKKLHLPAIRDSIIQKTSKVCSGSHIVQSSLGKYSYVGNFCTIVNTSIGSFCSVADNCIIGGASHPTDWISTSPVFHNGKNVLKKNFSRHEFIPTLETIIGNDVWIGNNCLIKSGIKIEDGAVIGMGSVVTKDVGAYEIWAGNPARFIRMRFSDRDVVKLKMIKWWNWNEDILKNNAIRFNDLNKFLNGMESSE